jgi:hypothetical protein
MWKVPGILGERKSNIVHCVGKILEEAFHVFLPEVDGLVVIAEIFGALMGIGSQVVGDPYLGGCMLGVDALMNVIGKKAPQFCFA